MLVPTHGTCFSRVIDHDALGPLISSIDSEQLLLPEEAERADAIAMKLLNNIADNLGLLPDFVAERIVPDVFEPFISSCPGASVTLLVIENSGNLHAFINHSPIRECTFIALKQHRHAPRLSIESTKKQTSKQL